MENSTDYPNNHRSVRGALQLWLRVIAVIAAVCGFFVAVFSAASLPTTAGNVVFAETYGGILSGALTLWIAAAILDALRVIAANSFKPEEPRS